MLKMLVFIDNWLLKQDKYSKTIKNKDMQFFMENLKMSRKRTKKNFEHPNFGGDSNSRFSVIFPPLIWIEGEGDEIKSKEAL